MTHPTTLLRAALLATAVAAPSMALADRPTEEVAFYYNRIAFQYGQPAASGDLAASTDAQPIGLLVPAVQAAREAARSHSTPLLTPIDPLPAKIHGDGSESVRKGGWVLDPSPTGPTAAPASKPKEIVVVGPKPAARSDLGQQLQLTLQESNVHRPAAPPAVVAAPTKPQPYTLIELLPLKRGK